MWVISLESKSSDLDGLVFEPS